MSSWRAKVASDVAVEAAAEPVAPDVAVEAVDEEDAPVAPDVAVEAAEEPVPPDDALEAAADDPVEVAPAHRRPGRRPRSHEYFVAALHKTRTPTPIAYRSITTPIAYGAIS